MWRGFGADSDSEPPPAQRSYFRPRISSISGVLAMTKQRLFTMGPKDDGPDVVPVSAGTGLTGHGGHHGAGVGSSGGGLHPSGFGPTLSVTEQYFLANGGALGRCPSPARSSYGDIMSFSRSASARPSIDSQIAHAVHGGDPLGIHDPSETELGGVGHENSGPFARKSGKIIRGLLLMIAVAVFWVATVHLFRMSFHRDRLLFSIGGRTSNGTTTTTPIPSSIRKPSWPAAPGNNNKSSPEMLPPPLPLNNKPKSKKRISINLNELVPRSNFDAPYLVSWYCTIWNILYLPVYLMIHAYFLSRRSGAKSGAASEGTNSGTNSAISSAVSQNPFGSNVSNKTRDTNTTDTSTTSIKKVLLESIQGLVDRGFTLLQFFYRCAFFCVLVTLANYMMIFSLRILDATVVMALLSSMVSIIYLLSWVVLHQQFVGIRIVGIIIVDTGVALLVYMDGVQHQTLATVMIAFGSAILFGVYKVFMRRMIGYTTFAQMALFHSLVGILNAIFAWPLILVLYATGVEMIVWSEIPWLYLTGASIAAFMANMMASFGLICTYEFFLTSGIFFAIPISAVIDIYLNSVIFRDMKLSGVLLIMAGFLVVLLPDNWNGYLTQSFRNRLKKWKRREENKKAGRVQDTTTGQLSRLRTSSGRVK